MSVVLYRPGNTHDIDGIRCEMGLFPVECLKQKIAEGWETDINKVKPSPKLVMKNTSTKVEIPDPPDMDSPVDEKIPLGISINSLSNPEIRDLARVNGYENWDTSRIETIKKFLRE